MPLIRTALHVTLQALHRLDVTKALPPKGEGEGLVTERCHGGLKYPITPADRDRLVGYLIQAEELLLLGETGMRFDVTVVLNVEDYQQLEEYLSSLSAVGGRIREIHCQQWGHLPVPAKYSKPEMESEA